MSRTRPPLPGTRVKLIRCTDSYSTIQPGTLGTVALVDDTGTVHVNWDDGHRLGLLEGHDQYEVIS